ncbi:MAG: hypothetical protein GVY13_18455 [Alphaproteobacteria bacterium]|jgi:uncharacterized protein involved in cysteine biosynthesis|nr:hypothetical protein [Alphaproteobacteria bacterium]
MITALVRAFDQLGDPAVRRVIWKSLLIAIAALAALVAAIGFGLSQVALVGWAWLDTLIDIAGGAGAAVLAVLLFPALLGLVTSELLDDVAAAVERRHYPHLGPARRQPVAEALWTAARFTAVMLVLNLLALALTWWLPLLNLAVFYLLNGYLLGREFFELVGLRRMAPGPLKGLRRAHRGRVLGAGILIALLTTVPLLNLLMPIIGAAFMVHIFQGVMARSSARF